MRLHVLSDIHFDHHRAGPTPWWEKLDATIKGYAPADAVIVAGDLAELARYSSVALDNLKRFCDRYATVIYVPGNHEFYGTSISAGTAKLLDYAASMPNLVLLRPGEIFKLGEQRFLGGTMWFPDPGSPGLERGLSDFRMIHNIRNEVYQEFGLFKAFLESKLQKGDIVVSHHGPSERSVAPQYKGDPGNCYFVTDMEDIIRSRKPAMWIHGHTHSPFNYTIGQTKVYTNPYGYPKEGSNPRFWSRVITAL
jgi:predicted phosphodiesterase